jgi:hypothetical protein
MTVQYVRLIAYIRPEARRQADSGRSRKPWPTGTRANPGLPGPGKVICQGGVMSTVTMEELELETAELLPSRETLCCCHPCRPCYQPGLELVIVVKVFLL